MPETLMMDPGIVYSRQQIASKAVACPMLLKYLVEGTVSLTVAAKACVFLDGKVAATTEDRSTADGKIQCSS